MSTSVQTINLGGQRFVILPEAEYQSLIGTTPSRQCLRPTRRGTIRRLRPPERCWPASSSAAAGPSV